MSDRFNDLIRAQYYQQDMFLRHRIVDEGERATLGVELAVGVIEQANQYLRLTERTALLPRREQLADRRSARKNQIIDILKYALALAHLDDFTSEELYAAFLDKTDTVRKRHLDRVSALKVASFDIDGVLCDLTGAGFDHDASEEEKARFFDSGSALICNPFPHAKELLDHLQQTGWGILLVTTRKRARHPLLESETYSWLEVCKIPYDRVIFSADKADAIISSKLPVRFHVEDSAKHALDVASAGIPVFYVGSAPIWHANVTTVPGLADIWAGELKEL